MVVVVEVLYLCIYCIYVLLCCFMYNVYMYMLYVCLCMLQCGRTALPNTGVENYKSINQSINQSPQLLGTQSIEYNLIEQ